MNKGRGIRTLGITVAGGLLVIAAFGMGFVSAALMRAPEVEVPQDVQAPANFHLYDRVWGFIDDEFFGERPAEEEITEAAMSGLVAAIDDPWALFVEDDEAASVADLSARAIPSLGVWVEPVANGVRVLSVIPDSPAAEAGIQPRDLIVAAEPVEDAQDLKASASDVGEGSGDDVTADDAEAVEEIIGPGSAEDAVPVMDRLSGDADALTIVAIRTGQAAFTSELVRQTTAELASAVEADAPEAGTVRITIRRFDSVTVDELDGALASLLRDAPPTDRVILDLRDNPGGDPATIGRVAGRFLDGDLWIEEDRAGNEEIVEADPAGADVRLELDDVPEVVVLVNRGTVGQAEALAAALRDRVDARLVGDRTFGRAQLPEINQLSDGSLVRLSERTWRTDAGTTVDADGLRPDVEVVGRDAQLEAALAPDLTALSTETAAEAAEASDDSEDSGGG